MKLTKSKVNFGFLAHLELQLEKKGQGLSHPTNGKGIDMLVLFLSLCYKTSKYMPIKM